MTFTPLAPAAPPRQAPPLQVNRRLFAAALSLSALMPPLLGFGGPGSALAILLLGAVTAVALAPGRDGDEQRLGAVELLPAATVFAMLGAAALGMLAAAGSIPLWADRPAAVVAWATLLGVAWSISGIRGGTVRLAAHRSSLLWLAVSGGVLLLPLLLLPFEQWARSVARGTDFPRHVLYVLFLSEDGWLDYSGDGYPRSAHATVALVQQAAGNQGFAASWQALQAVALLMAALITLATVLIARRSFEALQVPRWLAYGGVSLVFIVTMTGLWITNVLPSGYLTSLQAGLIVAAAGTLLWNGHSPNSLGTVAGLLALTAAMAHAWLLLMPMIAAPTAWLLVSLLRRREHRARLMSGVVAAGVVALPVVLASVTEVGIEHVGTAGGTSIPRPGLQWLSLLIATLVGTAAMSRRGRRTASEAFASSILALLGLMALLLIMVRWSGGDWYYVTKTAWTPLSILVGVGVPATLWAGWRVGVGLAQKPNVANRAKLIRGGAVAIAVLLSIALTWTGGIFQSQRVLWGTGTRPALSIPLMNQFLASPKASEGVPAIVWGLSPHMGSDLDSLVQGGAQDFIAAGLLNMLGHPLADGASAGMLFSRDARAVCDYLRENPQALRITGPAPGTTLGWLIDAGCPAEVVQPTTWTSIAIDPAWFGRTQFADAPYGTAYPSWAQAKAQVEQLREEYSPLQ